MVYKTTFFRKQLRQAYIDGRAGLRRQAAFALFSGLISFAVYFVLQTLRRSVLADAVPHILQQSYFSTVFLYVHLTAALMTAYFLIYFEHIFFTDIRRNIWYMLIHLGHSPAKLTVQKMLAWLSSTAAMYTLGFVFIILLTGLLRFPFVPAYLPGLYFAGLCDVILIGAVMMALSLLVSATSSARRLAVFFFAALYALKAVTGFYKVLSNRAAMQNLRNVFNPARSAYMLLCGALFCIFVLTGAVAARRLAQYYATPGRGLGPLPPGTRIIIPDARGAAPEKPRRGGAVLSAAVTGLLVLVMAAAVLFNVLVILLAVSKPGRELTVRGVIPYIFQSETMRPEIEYNDLAYFRRIDAQHPLNIGDVVLFESGGTVYVERIQNIDGELVTVDIDAYPPLAEAGAMRKTVPRESIYGLYAGRNRWLGVLILFSNTIIGRITLLLLPAVLLFYRRQILAYLRKKRRA